MRGSDEQTASLFSYVSCEARVPSDHPLRLIRAVVDEALKVLSPGFDGIYAQAGRPSIAPEKLPRALLLQAFYSIRSERQLMEQLDYNPLFRPAVAGAKPRLRAGRWFVGLAMDAPVWDASTFSKNRDRLLEGDVAQTLLSAVITQPRVKALMSDDHFSVDGTLIQAWASQKSFQAKPPPDTDGGGDDPPGSGITTGEDSAKLTIFAGRNQERDWRGQKRSNETHASVTDPDARLARKSNGQSSILAYAGHVMMENRSGLVARVCLTHATGTAERDAALTMVKTLKPRRRITLGTDKGYDAAAFIASLRERRVTAHIAPDTHLTKTGKRRRSAIDRRTTRHAGYGISQRVRKRIEEVFGWVKSTAGLRQTKHRGRDRVGWCFALATTAYNLIRLPRLLATADA